MEFRVLGSFLVGQISTKNGRIGSRIVPIDCAWREEAEEPIGALVAHLQQKLGCIEFQHGEMEVGHFSPGNGPMQAKLALQEELIGSVAGIKFGIHPAFVAKMAQGGISSFWAIFPRLVLHLWQLYSSQT